MFASLTEAVGTVAAQVPADTVVYGPFHGGFSPWFLLFPLFWILVIGLFIFVARRTWRRNHHWAASQGAEGVLRERYARGEIDEVEFRQRLEVLRSGDLPKR
ncbi:MAG TPA: SHOCT domain-containing protein [Arthrobacter sp.]|jgi:putative membrane protein